MNSELVIALMLIVLSTVLLCVGLYWRIYPHVFASLVFYTFGFYHLYYGLPLELRERRSRAIRRRWEKLDEEENERAKKKRE